MKTSSLWLALVVLLFVHNAARADFIAIATLAGDGESPSTGTGNGEVLFNSTTGTLTIKLTFTGLESPTTIPPGVPGPAHIHFGEIVPGGPILFPFVEPYANTFPLGVTSGTYDTVLTSASFLPDPANGIDTYAEAVSAIETGQTYFNIHTVEFPGGEIAGQIKVIPEPSTWAMMLLGFGGLAFLGYRQARRAKPQAA